MMTWEDAITQTEFPIDKMEHEEETKNQLTLDDGIFPMKGEQSNG